MRVRSFLEKPANPPPIPGQPGRALASMGIYVFNARFLYEQLSARHRRPASPATTSARTSSPIWCRATACSRTASSTAASGMNDNRALLARRRHGRRVLGGEHRPDPRHARSSTCTTRTGRSGPTRSSCRRPSSCSTTTAGAAWRSIRWCPAAASSAARRVRRSLLFSNVRVHSFCTIEDSVILPDVVMNRHVRLRRVRHRQGAACCPEGFTAGFDPEQDRRRFHVTEKGITLITPDMLGQKVIPSLTSLDDRTKQAQPGAAVAHAPAGFPRPEHAASSAIPGSTCTR